MRYYTYLWLREDGTPYYVGKGCNDRAYTEHDRQKPPDDSNRIILEYHPTEDEAYIAEMMLIAAYGRKDLGTGCLRNMSDGGKGGLNPSQETRKLQRSAKLRNPTRYWLGKKRPDISETFKKFYSNMSPELRSKKGRYSRSKVKNPFDLSSLSRNLKNTTWITNGVDSMQVEPSQPIPTGWRRGMACESYNKNRKCITDGHTNRFIRDEETIPSGWRQGMTKRLNNGKFTGTN